VRLPWPAAAVLGIFSLSYASVVIFVAPWSWIRSSDPNGSWIVLTADPGQPTGPYDVGVDARGNVYGADAGADHVLILSPAGVPLAHWGTPACSAAESMAIDADGDVYIGHTAFGSEAMRGSEGHDFLIRKYSPTGDRLDEWGASEPYGSVLSEITSLAIAPDGHVYAADWRNHRIIRLSPDGEQLPSWSTGARRPMALAADGAGNLYVGYAGGFLIDGLSASGKHLGSWRTGRAYFDTIRFGLAVDRDGTIYASDPIGAPHLLKMSPAGYVMAEFGSEGDAAGQFRSADRLAVDAERNLYVTDRRTRYVQKFTPAP
jgi:sugar lactone lactonase YvrE